MTPLECVARAIDPFGCNWGNNFGHGFFKRKAIKMASSAIEAHKAALEDAGLVIVPRKPTDAMCRVAAGSADDFGHNGDMWRAMIAEALK